MEQINLPRRLFLISISIGVLIPFLARLPNVPFHGWDWFTDYLPGVDGILFFSVCNLIPAIALFLMGLASRRAPLAYWFAVAGLAAFLLWVHGGFNLRSSSTAAIGLIFIPVYSIGALVIAWFIGLIIHAIIREERKRMWLAGIVISVAVVGAIATNVIEAVYVSKRESRFPVVSVSETPLKKHVVNECCSIGGLNVIAFNHFDLEEGKEIVVLGTDGVAKLDRENYTVKYEAPFNRKGCDNCVHMYSYIVPDEKGSFYVATSDGLSDHTGQFLWGTNAQGFSRVVPIKRPNKSPAFLSYHRGERIALHSEDGNVLWTKKIPVNDIGLHVNADGENVPFAITGYRDSRKLHLYNASGAEIKSIKLPEWALNIQSIAWPTSGHLLIGGGSWVGVLDPEGKEIFRHVIQDTSFYPYHGPDGVAVKLGTSDKPYLAVMSHGSSGYARSVLLVFDPEGDLVWKEETHKLRSILAIPSSSDQNEVLLVGGMKGIEEYSLSEEK